MTPRPLPVLWTRGAPANPKTGDIPTGYIGATEAETRASCEGCPLLAHGCYAWAGGPNMVRSKIQARAARGEDHSLEGALVGRLHDRKRMGRPLPRAVRLGAIGDPGRLRANDLRALARRVRDEAGLALLAYSHHWRALRARDLAGVLMASVGDATGADEAAAAGWRAAAIIDSTEPVVTTPGGRRLLACPAQRTHNATTCEDCRLCDPTRLRRYAGVFFRPHGPLAPKTRGGAASPRAASPRARPDLRPGDVPGSRSRSRAVRAARMQHRELAAGLAAAGTYRTGPRPPDALIASHRARIEAAEARLRAAGYGDRWFAVEAAIADELLACRA